MQAIKVNIDGSHSTLSMLSLTMCHSPVAASLLVAAGAASPTASTHRAWGSSFYRMTNAYFLYLRWTSLRLQMLLGVWGERFSPTASITLNRASVVD